MKAKGKVWSKNNFLQKSLLQVDPYFQYFSYVLSNYQYPISTYSSSSTSLIITPLLISFPQVTMFHWLIMMQVRGSSLHNRGARWFESIRPSWGFLTTRHMQVLNLHISTFTRILQNVNRSTLPESTVLHLPAPLLVDSQDGYTLLSPSPTPSAQLSFHIME